MIQKEAIHLNVSLDGERKPESFRGTAKLFAFDCAARGEPSWAAERFKCKRQLVPKPDAPVAAEQGPQTTTHAKTAQNVEHERDLRLFRQPRMATGKHHAELAVLDCARAKNLLDRGSESPLAIEQSA